MRPEVNKIRLTVLIAMLFSALCAGVFRTTPIIFMAALLCGAPLVGFVIGRLSNRKLRLTRQLPEIGKVGDIVSERLTLSNTARWPILLVHVRSAATSQKLFKRKKGSSEDAQSALRQPAMIPLGEHEFDAPILRAHEEVTWQRQWLLHRRGVHAIAPVQAGALDPLGLYNRLPARSQSSEIVILPRPIKIERLGFMGGAGGANLIPRHSAIVADASDFHGARPWQAGEAIRRAHWKSTARTGQLHVIEWEETPTTDLAIFLDTSAQTMIGDEENNSLETAITAAASVAVHLLENGCRVQLFYYQPPPNDNREANSETAAPVLRQPILHHLEARSVDGTNKILRALAEIKPLTGTTGTLPQLVEAGMPGVARSAGVLLLASARADHAAALTRTRMQTGALQSHVLAFDASPLASPEAGGVLPGDDETLPTPLSRMRHQSISPAGGRQQRYVRVVRGEDSLAAALEGRI